MLRCSVKFGKALVRSEGFCLVFVWPDFGLNKLSEKKPMRSCTEIGTECGVMSYESADIGYCNSGPGSSDV